MYYAKARMYDPLDKRFTQIDPVSPKILNPSTYNLYVYGQNNPLVKIDPNGREVITLSVLGLALAGTATIVVAFQLTQMTVEWIESHYHSTNYAFSNYQNYGVTALVPAGDGTYTGYYSNNSSWGRDRLKEANQRTLVKPASTYLTGESSANNGIPASAAQQGNSYQEILSCDAVSKKLGGIAGKYGNFECVQASEAMKDFLIKNKQKGQVIILQFPQNPGFVWSNTANKVIPENGRHQGVKYNGLVYCNVHPFGLPEPQWIADFEEGFGRAPQITRINFP